MTKKYRELKTLDLPAIDKEVLDYWDREKIFEKSVSSREGNPTFVFYEGPPSANGLPGIHHVFSRTIKDFFCRYKTLRGFQVNRKAGWDTHGLPIELAVEKTLGIRKDDIGKSISIEDYNAACRREVMKYTDRWEELTRIMGYWVDMQHPYITFKNYYIESVWWLLKNLHDKNLLYKGYTIQPYSPAAGTGLSTHELNQPGCYRPVKDTTVVAQFKLKECDAACTDEVAELLGSIPEDVFFLAWTTTPWTLPSNTALAVGKNISYSIVKTYNQYTHQPVIVILAKDLLGKYFSEKNSTLKIEGYKPGDKAIPFRVIGETTGALLAGIRYEQLLPYAQPVDGDSFKVVIGDFVSTEDGTGIVHIAPSFGADDFRTAKQNGLGSLTLVDRRGRFTEEMGEFAGEFVKEQYLNDGEKEVEKKKQCGEKYLSVDERIAIKLKKENKAFKVEKYEHNYPHCWRTDKPILYYPLDSWFVKTTDAKERLVELNKTINWKPESTGSGRFGNWLENLQDWNLSRSRFWGIPLPIWRTEDDAEEKCIGSLKDLFGEIEKSVAAGFMKSNPVPAESVANPDIENAFDLHRPFVDEIILMSDSGKPMRRETDLIDVWFDSGSMPYAQLHYPFENKNEIDARKNYPADFIAEGVDQTRGWFFTLHAIAVMCFDSVAYKNVVSNGLLLDKNGNKMSKRLGNVVDPFSTIGKYGADVTRWYLITNSLPWDNLKFDMSGIEEVRRSFFGTLYNTYSFFALYANIDGFTGNEKQIPVEDRPEIDRWVLSLLNSLIKKVTAGYDQFEPTEATRAIQEFVGEHLSNWYVRLNRRRYWKGEAGIDKTSAYQTLFTCLDTISRLIAPTAPFFAEFLFRNLNPESGSVHLGQWPGVDENAIDAALERRMQLAQEVSSLVLSLRKKAILRVRQPLQKILIPVLNDQFKSDFEAIKNIVLNEVNIKEIEYVTGENGIIRKKIKADFKKLGQKLGQKMKAASAILSAFSQAQITEIEKNGRITIDVTGDQLEILLDEVEVFAEDIPGWMVANKGAITVALDINLTDSLRTEGTARELISSIQKLRKESGFLVTDRIKFEIQKNPITDSAITGFKDYICAEILAENLEITPNLHNGVEIIINDSPVRVNITSHKN